MGSNGALFFLCLMILYVDTSGDRASTKPPSNKKIVTCYVSSWATYRIEEGKFEIKDIRPELCTHLVYAFAGIDASKWEIRSLDPTLDIVKGGYKSMTKLRSQYPNLKVLLAIGGWNEGTGNFSKLASDPKKKATFIKSVVSFLNLYKFDGLDLDWEFPEEKDKENFVALTKDLKTVLDRNNFLLTAAISASPFVLDKAYDIPGLSKYLDYIHVMAYDYHGLWDKVILPNAPLNSNDGASVEGTIDYLLHLEAPADKLIVGLPMYGKTYILDSESPPADKNPIGLPCLKNGFKGPFTQQEGFMGYNEICKEMTENQEEWWSGWDNKSHTPYLLNVNNNHVIVYDDHKSIDDKIDYIKSANLGGVMIWSIDTDDFHGDFNCPDLPENKDFPLMRRINAALGDGIAIQVDDNDDNFAEKPRLNVASILCTIFILYYFI